MITQASPAQAMAVTWFMPAVGWILSHPRAVDVFISGCEAGLYQESLWAVLEPPAAPIPPGRALTTSP